MTKRVEVALTDEADEFVEQLPPAIRSKFSKAFEKTEGGFTGKWFKKMSSTEEIWEFRVSAANHIYRLFAFWDKSGETETLIICTHGLDKKTQKTPKTDIDRAERIRREYFAS